MRFEMAVPNMYFVHGSGKVFDLLESKAGITGIGVNTIMEELTGPEQGSRFPSMVDKLNRPLDGKDVIYVRNHSTFEPDLSLYKETNIRPPYAHSRHQTGCAERGADRGEKARILLLYHGRFSGHTSAAWSG